MKQRLLILLILLCLLLTACKEETPVYPSPPIPVSPTVEATTVPPTETTAVTDPVVTAPAHSPLYIPGVTVEDVIRYFNEVCLDAEFSSGGDPSYLQKWTAPIRYMLFGTPTDADLATLSGFTQWLNTIEGFPNIAQTVDPASANLRIHFCTEKELLNLLGDNFYGTDGGVTFWYSENEIYDAIICYRTDLDQQLRNSVILEEIYNGLGPVQDTDLRTDSIIYSGYSQPQSLTPIDELLLKLLYHPEMQCGMNADQCEEIIRKLYY